MIQQIDGNRVGGVSDVQSPGALLDQQRQVLRQAASAYPLSETSGSASAMDAISKAMMTLAKKKKNDLDREAQQKAQAGKEGQGCGGGGGCSKGGAEGQKSAQAEPEKIDNKSMNTDWDKDRLDMQSRTTS